jgi:hypothetical protein
MLIIMVIRTQSSSFYCFAHFSMLHSFCASSLINQILHFWRRVSSSLQVSEATGRYVRVDQAHAIGLHACTLVAADIQTKQLPRRARPTSFECAVALVQQTLLKAVVGPSQATVALSGRPSSPATISFGCCLPPRVSFPHQAAQRAGCWGHIDTRCAKKPPRERICFGSVSRVCVCVNLLSWWVVCSVS